MDFSYTNPSIVQPSIQSLQPTLQQSNSNNRNATQLATIWSGVQSLPPTSATSQSTALSGSPSESTRMLTAGMPPTSTVTSLTQSGANHLPSVSGGGGGVGDLSKSFVESVSHAHPHPYPHSHAHSSHPHLWPSPYISQSQTLLTGAWQHHTSPYSIHPHSTQLSSSTLDDPTTLHYQQQQLLHQQQQQHQLQQLQHQQQQQQSTSSHHPSQSSSQGPPSAAAGGGGSYNYGLMTTNTMQQSHHYQHSYPPTIWNPSTLTSHQQAMSYHAAPPSQPSQHTLPPFPHPIHTTQSAPILSHPPLPPTAPTGWAHSMPPIPTVPPHPSYHRPQSQSQSHSPPPPPQYQTSSQSQSQSQSQSYSHTTQPQPQPPPPPPALTPSLSPTSAKRAIRSSKRRIQRQQKRERERRAIELQHLQQQPPTNDTNTPSQLTNATTPSVKREIEQMNPLLVAALQREHASATEDGTESHSASVSVKQEPNPPPLSSPPSSHPSSVSQALTPAPSHQSALSRDPSVESSTSGSTVTGVTRPHKRKFQSHDHRRDSDDSDRDDHLPPSSPTTAPVTRTSAEDGDISENVHRPEQTTPTLTLTSNSSATGGGRIQLLVNTVAPSGISMVRSKFTRPPLVPMHRTPTPSPLHPSSSASISALSAEPVTVSHAAAGAAGASVAASSAGLPLLQEEFVSSASESSNDTSDEWEEDDGNRPRMTVNTNNSNNSHSHPSSSSSSSKLIKDPHSTSSLKPSSRPSPSHSVSPSPSTSTSLSASVSSHPVSLVSPLGSALSLRNARRIGADRRRRAKLKEALNMLRDIITRHGQDATNFDQVSILYSTIDLLRRCEMMIEHQHELIESHDRSQLSHASSAAPSKKRTKASSASTSAHTTIIPIHAAPLQPPTLSRQNSSSSTTVDAAASTIPSVPQSVSGPLASRTDSPSPARSDMDQLTFAAESFAAHDTKRSQSRAGNHRSSSIDSTASVREGPITSDPPAKRRKGHTPTHIHNQGQEEK